MTILNLLPRNCEVDDGGILRGVVYDLRVLDHGYLLASA
jgi:hypothetical protein